MLLLQHKLQMALTSLVLDVITGTASIELLVTSLCKKRNDIAVSGNAVDGCGQKLRKDY